MYACCPGWCQTDMTKGTGAPKTADQGAETPAMLVGLPFKIDPKIQGLFFFEGCIDEL